MSLELTVGVLRLGIKEEVEAIYCMYTLYINIYMVGFGQDIRQPRKGRQGLTKAVLSRSASPGLHIYTGRWSGGFHFGQYEPVVGVSRCSASLNKPIKTGKVTDKPQAQKEQW